MGTDSVHYIIVGINFDYKSFVNALEESGNSFDDFLDAYDDNAYKEEITVKNGLTLVADGMNTEYLILGKVVVKAMDHEGFPLFNALDSNVIDLKDLVRERVISLLQEMKVAIEIPQVGIYVFTHWH